MSTILQFLRNGFESLEGIPKTDLDNLVKDIKKFRLNPQKSVEKLQELIAQTSYFHGVVGSNLAKVHCIKADLDRRMERRRVDVAKANDLAPTQTAAVRNACIEDPQYMDLWEKYSEVEAMEKYFHNMKETLYMDFYALRNENDTAVYNNNTSARVNHGF